MRKFVLVCLIGFCTLQISTLASAQKAPEACDREVRVANQVLLTTPRGLADGRVCLDDGDSFSLGAAWLRFKEFDAPDIGRNCLEVFDALKPHCAIRAAGIESLVRLAALLEGGAECRAERTDNYNRWLATCTLPGGRNLAEAMIAEGYACATESGVEFRSLELTARKEKKGIWSDQFDGKRQGFPSRWCVITNPQFKRHLRYIKSKASPVVPDVSRME